MMNGYVIGIAAMVLGVVYWQYTSMVEKIKEQEVAIANKEIVIEVQKKNAEAAKEKYAREVKAKVEEAKAVVKKEEVEKGIEYDKSNSRLLTSTRIDLP